MSALDEKPHTDHVTPWCKGGLLTIENGRMLGHDETLV